MTSSKYRLLLQRRAQNDDLCPGNQSVPTARRHRLAAFLLASLLPGLVFSVGLTGATTLPTAPAVSIGVVHGAFYGNPNNSGAIDTASLSIPAFTQDFPTVDFNPPSTAQVACSMATGVNEDTRPFTNVLPNPDGTCSTTAAQGAGHQAGTGDLFAFQAVFTANLTVAATGQVTFNFFSDDGWMLGSGPRQGGTEQPTYVSGSNLNPLSATPIAHFPVVGSFNTNSAPAQNQVTVNFPAAGTYPIELDYTECCGGQLAFVLGTTFGNPIPASGSVLGLGDSIAAGYGLGQAAGTPDNRNAYPYLVGSALGAQTFDYAVSGACAVSTTPPACRPTSVLAEIKQAQAAGVHPSIVTLTVGANDLDFQDCLTNYFLAAIGFNAQACSQDQTNQRIESFQNDLRTDLQAIRQNFPNSLVVLTPYYNPFPEPVLSFGDTCALYEALPTAAAFVQLTNQEGLLGGVAAALGLVTSPVAFQNEVVQLQGLVYAHVQSEVDGLNEAITRESVEFGTKLASLVDFSGHDFCASENGRTPYVFGPDIAASGSVSGHGPSFSTPGPRCDPKFAFLDPPSFDQHDAASSPLGDVAYSVHVAANCLPHPTADGQADIARNIVQVVQGAVINSTSNTNTVPGGTAVTSISAASGQVVTVTGHGTGTVSTTLYATDPVPGVGTATFASSGVFFDAAVNGPNEGGPGNDFSEVDIQDCDLSGGDTVEWWNQTGGPSGQGAWQPVSNETPPTGSPPCITIVITNATSPSLRDLTGTVFGVRLATATDTQVVASPNPAVTGQPVTYSATVKPPPVGGTVSFFDNGVPLRRCQSLRIRAANCTVTYIAPGLHSILAVFSGSPGFFGSASAPFSVGTLGAPLVEAVGCGTTITGAVNGRLAVHGSTCLRSATVNGLVSVDRGATLTVVSSQLHGVLQSESGSGLQICGSSFAGNVLVSASTAPIVLGDAGDDGFGGCAANTFNGAVTLANNLGAVEVGGNTIHGRISINGTTTPSSPAENGGVELEANQIRGRLDCLGNTPPPTNDNHPNAVIGARNGQCSGL